jgi:hypothetical protein
VSADIYISAPHCCDAHGHNITHNLAAMFRAAGVNWRDYYEHDGNGGRTAAEMLPEVVTAYCNLRAYPEDYKHLEAENGWGLLTHAVDFLERLMRDLARHPDGIVSVSL